MKELVSMKSSFNIKLKLISFGVYPTISINIKSHYCCNMSCGCLIQLEISLISYFINVPFCFASLEVLE